MFLQQFSQSHNVYEEISDANKDPSFDNKNILSDLNVQIPAINVKISLAHSYFKHIWLKMIKTYSHRDKKGIELVTNVN